MSNKETIKAIYSLIDREIGENTVLRKEYKELSEKLCKQDDLLKKYLTSKQYKMFQNYLEIEVDTTLLELEETFIYGFSLAVKLILNSLEN